MRDLGQVLDNLIVELPTWEVKFKENLVWLKNNLPYTAPEANWSNWEIAAAFIAKYIPKPPTHDWHWNFLVIWMDKSDQELRRMFK